MRMAGRFARRVRASAQAHGIPVIDCTRGERKHRIAEEYLDTHVVGVGVFLILVARAVAPVWEVRRSANGVITNLEKKKAFVNHYSFHLMDPAWGHLTVKMSGHPPFGAQVILNGHEYVACQAQAAGIGFGKEGNFVTSITDPTGLARVADTLSQSAAIGRLSQACDRWIYSACLCFGLDLDEQQRSGFGYAYSVYQPEYSRNLVFRSGRRMEQVFDRVVDRARARLDVATLQTLFGAKNRPHSNRAAGPPTLAVAIERRYGLTLFKVHFGLLTLKAYPKGEHVLRFEAIVHNTHKLGCGRILAKFPTDHHAARGHGRAVRHRPGLRRRRLPARPHARPVAAVRPDRADPGRRRRPEQGTDPRRPGRGARPCRPAQPGSPSPTSPARSTPSRARPPRGTPAGRPPTTCASSAATTSSANRCGHAGT